MKRFAQIVMHARGAMIIVAVVALLNESRSACGETSPSRIHQAVRKSLDLIEQSAVTYREQRECFSCHHQAMTTMTLAVAKEHGFSIEEENFQQQVRHTLEHLKRGKSSYERGRGQGGRADTAGYALWTLDAGGHAADETTSLVSQWLLKWHDDKPTWQCTSNRPPSEASDITTTYLALRALDVYADADQQEQFLERKGKSQKWLTEVPCKDTEDLVFRLRTLHLLEADQDQVDEAAAELLRLQQDDGGFAQLPQGKSDAYATGSALVALYEAGVLTADDDAYQRGLRFLLDSQLEDGSWHVVSRSKPFQTYFESGFPHGKDQFISISATCWAVWAMIFAADVEPVSITHGPITHGASPTDSFRPRRAGGGKRRSDR